MSDRPNIGPTGDFPEGKLRADDEGGIRFAIGVQGGNVVLDFGKPTVWVGMPPEQAEQLAAMLTKHAATARASRS